jgi:two-component system cell cycle sensor histidine kinase/response regulator CckA
MFKLPRVSRPSLLHYSTGLLLMAALLLFIWPGLAGNLLSTEFGTEMFMPHRYCYAEVPSLVFLHLTTDTLIGVSYTVISITLAYLVYRARRDIPFHWIFLAFGLFIVACGATHFMEVLTLWKATYWLAGYVKLVTATASVATAAVLPFVIRPALTLVKDAKAAEERRRELEATNRALTQEVEERLRTEQALRENVERFRISFDHAAVGKAVVSPDGRWLQVNPSLCEMLGHREEDLLTTDFQTLTHPDDLELDMDYVSQMLAREIRTYQMEKRYIHKQGSVVWGLLSVSLVRDAEGKPLYFISEVQDITERKHAEDQLNVERRLISTLFDQLPVGVLFRKMDGHYKQANKTSSRILGIAEEELIEMRSDRMWSLVKAATVDDAPLDPQNTPSMVAIRTERATEPLELLITTPAGERRRLSVSAAPLVGDKGKLFGSVTVITDITEQHVLQEQLLQAQKVESIGVLAGGIAHDFNNLLTAILGYCQLTLRRLTADDRLYRNVLEIKKAADRATKLTAQLLAFSRKQILQPKVMDLNETVSNISKMLRQLIGEDIDLVSVLHSQLEMIRADPSQIEQVIMNLAINARDAMPMGGKLTIETAYVELDENYARQHAGVQPGPYVMLAVSDTGTGIHPQLKERIFEPFFTTKGVGKGTGLGLSTVYGIVKQSGGNIWVYSEEGLGTTFKIYLPRLLKSGKAETPPETPLEAPQGNEVVLLVEDEELVRNMTTDILGIHGYHVLVAANGQEAIKICEEYGGQIDLMLTDVVMPRISGKQLYELCRPFRPAMRVLFMSGYTDNAIVHHGVLDEGINFIQKPFTPDKLARKIREVIDGSGQS